MKIESNEPTESLVKLASDLEGDVNRYIENATNLCKGLIGITTYPKNPGTLSSSKLIIHQEGMDRFRDVADLYQVHSSSGHPEYSHVLLAGFQANIEITEKIREGLRERGLDNLTHPLKISEEGALKSIKLVVQRRAPGIIAKDGAIAVGETGALISVQSELLGGNYRDFTVDPEVLAQNPERGIALIDGMREILRDVWPLVERTFPDQSKSIGKTKNEDTGTMYSEFEIL